MKTAEFSHWLFHQGRFNIDFKSFIQALCDKLVELGMPISRARINFSALHPQVVAWSCIWTQGSGSEVIVVGKEVRETEDYIGSPIAYIHEQKQPFRQNLLQLPDNAHSVLFEFRDSGLTDYAAYPVFFSNNTVNVATFATDSPSGFSANCIDFLTEVSVLIAPFIENLANQRLARNLLETYIGPRTGRRILEGQIQRGDGEEINAAIWFSDFRNFTHYTETLPPQVILDTLNRYFEIVHDNVIERGGEILRFIGDAMLIVFPVDEFTTSQVACSNALAAALSALQDTAEHNACSRDAAMPAIEFGVGLHQGCVMYGNVGAPARLDFTVMGVAVNRAARLESLTKELGCPVLMSAEFNRQAGTSGRFKGKFAVKGVKTMLEAWSPE